MWGRGLRVGWFFRKGVQHVRKLPSGITATTGNQALVDWVRNLIK